MPDYRSDLQKQNDIMFIKAKIAWHTERIEALIEKMGDIIENGRVV